MGDGYDSESVDLSSLTTKQRNWIRTILDFEHTPYKYNQRSKIITVDPRYPADQKKVERLIKWMPWYMTFVPMKHRSLIQIPHDSDQYKGDDEKQHIVYTFRHAATRAYWRKVEDIAHKKGVDWLKAREILHASGTLPPRRKEREAAGDKRFWNEDDMIMSFMLQFEDWQQKTFDPHLMHRAENKRAQLFSWEIGKNRDVSVAQYVALVCDNVKNELPQFLIYCNRHDDAAKLVDDPIWGDFAESELQTQKRMESFKTDEMLRIAQSHEHIQEIDAIIREGSPSNYAVFYPYPPYGIYQDLPPEHRPPQPFHNIPDCLTIMADGSTIFRLQVLDTKGLTTYKLADLKKPWWGMNSGIGKTPEPWEGEYDFDFPEFGIEEGVEFTHEKLIEVLKHGIERIKTRGERKYGTK